MNVGNRRQRTRGQFSDRQGGQLDTIRTWEDEAFFFLQCDSCLNAQVTTGKLNKNKRVTGSTSEGRKKQQKTQKHRSRFSHATPRRLVDLALPHFLEAPIQELFQCLQMQKPSYLLVVSGNRK